MFLTFMIYYVTGVPGTMFLLDCASRLEKNELQLFLFLNNRLVKVISEVHKTFISKNYIIAK